MSTATTALRATRLLYPEHRTNVITDRMQRRLAERQGLHAEAAGWMRVIYRLGRAAGLTPAKARAQAHASVTAPLPF